PVGSLSDDVDMIYFACDAGMGSSAMGASLLRKKAKEANLDVKITNKAISALPADAKVVITQEELTPRAVQKVGSAYHISVDNFLSSPKYDELIADLKALAAGESIDNSEAKLADEADMDETDNGLLRKENVFLNQSFASKED